MEARKSLELGPCHHVIIMITGSLSPVCWCQWSLPGTLEDGRAGGGGKPVPRRALFADTLLFWGGEGKGREGERNIHVVYVKILPFLLDTMFFVSWYKNDMIEIGANYWIKNQESSKNSVIYGSLHKNQVCYIQLQIWSQRKQCNFIKRITDHWDTSCPATIDRPVTPPVYPDPSCWQAPGVWVRVVGVGRDNSALSS